MADSPILPNVERWVDANRQPLPAEFFRFFRSLLRYIQQTNSNDAIIAEILARLDELEAAGNATIQGLQSVVVQGTLAGGLVNLLLQGDQQSPGPVRLYSTNESGAKGWNPIFPEWVPNPYADYLVDEDGNYLTDENGNFLVSQDGFPIPLEYGGTGGDYSDVPQNTVWAAPEAGTGAPSFRLIGADDVPNHNDLNGLQGGNATERNHITDAEYTGLSEVIGSDSGNLVWATPDGSSGAPSFRALTTGDLPAAPELVCGQEYLYAIHSKLISGTAAKITFSGDSTTEGGGSGASGQFILSTSVLNEAVRRNFYNVTTVNAGHSGAATNDWVSTYLAADLAGAPDLYVIRWGLNDPFYGRTLSQFETSLRQGLTTIRASYSLSQMSILLMVPNTANDTANGRDEAWLEQVKVVCRQAAEDFQCAFIDTFSIWPDAQNAAGRWMDDIGGGVALHPKNEMNSWISTVISNLIFPCAITPKNYGTYTPTLTAVANIASSAPFACQWMRVGNMVTVSGRVDIACTAAANTLTQLGISVPVASNFTSSANLGGASAIGQPTYQPIVFYADSTNDRAMLQFLSNGTANAACFFTFSYRVM